MGKFVKGQSGNPKGLPKGTIKRARVRVKVRDILDDLGFDPFREAVELYRTTKKERIKCDLIIDLCNYIAPKLRAVEITQENENPFVITLNLAPKKKQKEILNSVIELADEKEIEL